MYLTECANSMRTPDTLSLCRFMYDAKKFYLKKALEKVCTALLQKKMNVFLKTQLEDSARSLLIAAIKSLRIAELY